MFLGIILAVLFGPFGVLYASISAGLIMIVVYLAIVAISAFTVGFGSVLYLFAWPVGVFWSVLAISEHNKKAM